MSMSRKDFEAIARVLKGVRHTMSTDAHVLLVNDFADYLSTTNPAFNRARFISAAGKFDYLSDPGRTPRPEESGDFDTVWEDNDDLHMWCDDDH